MVQTLGAGQLRVKLKVVFYVWMPGLTSCPSFPTPPAVGGGSSLEMTVLDIMRWASIQPRYTLLAAPMGSGQAVSLS